MPVQPSIQQRHESVCRGAGILTQQFSVWILHADGPAPHFLLETDSYSVALDCKAAMESEGQASIQIVDNRTGEEITHDPGVDSSVYLG
jgi:hypothetical protein